MTRPRSPLRRARELMGATPAGAGHFHRVKGARDNMEDTMSRCNLPYFPFYPADFFADPEVELMSNREVGVYLRLLCHAWKRGGLPTDIRRLARIAHEPPDEFAEMWPAIEPCWHEHDGQYFNGRMEQERASAVEAHTKAVERGKAGAEARWNKQCSSNGASNRASNAQAIATQNSELITQRTPSSVPTEPAAPDDSETWNERLAPLARALNPNEVGNWLAYWKPICTTAHKVDEAEEIMWGLRWLIDKNQLEETHGIRKGGTCKPSILRSPRADILVRNCLEAYGRHAPNQGVDMVRKLTAI